MGPPSSPGARRARVDVVGLGPAGPDLVPPASLELIAAAGRCLVRTARHPSAAEVRRVATGPVDELDRLYERSERFEDVYRAIVDEVVAAATSAPPGSTVVYAVPGSPLVAERTVDLLRADGRVELHVVPAPSFLDLAWERLGVDPVAEGVRLVDGTAFAPHAAGERGPLLVAQCHARSVLSAVKLAVDDPSGEADERRAVLLHHLGLDDEQVVEVRWADLDRTLEPDHLTSVWVPVLAPPVGAELVRLEELVRTLRARCPWDRQQTHGSLARHLLEEAYEALDAVEAVAAAGDGASPAVVRHLEEELGDLVFQVFFHAQLATEEGYFTMADVARALHDKLVARHPHVFGDATATTPDEVAARWEVLKKAEKGRTSVTEGIPATLPSLSLAAELLRKARGVGVAGPSPDDAGRRLAALVALGARPAGTAGVDRPDAAADVGALLFALVELARRLDVDAELALRARATAFRSEVQAAEAGP